MKDFALLMSTAAGFALIAWVFWHFTGISGLNAISTLALIAVTVDNIRLRRQLRTKQ